MSRRVWVKLLDSDGKPYKNTSADKVSVESSADVADFRDAVKAKHSNKLSLVDAADLLVYKNKNDKSALISSHPLVGLGNTEEEAMIVMVQSMDKKRNSMTNF